MQFQFPFYEATKGVKPPFHKRNFAVNGVDAAMNRSLLRDQGAKKTSEPQVKQLDFGVEDSQR